MNIRINRDITMFEYFVPSDFVTMHIAILIKMIKTIMITCITIIVIRYFYLVFYDNYSI